MQLSFLFSLGLLVKMPMAICMAKMVNDAITMNVPVNANMFLNESSMIISSPQR